jgi:hypothetical protein
VWLLKIESEVRFSYFALLRLCTNLNGAITPHYIAVCCYIFKETAMTKSLLTILGLLTINSVFGQKVINNTKTDKHKQINGAKFFLIPPTGFIDATSFQGFQQLNSGSSILVMELPGPFTESTKGFNEQGLKTQGVILKKKEEIKVNGNQGFF